MDEYGPTPGPAPTIHAERAGAIVERESAVAQDQAPMAAVIHLEDSALERLAFAVEALEDKLGPVLSPSYPHDAATLVEPDRRSFSTVVEHGYRHISVIEGLADRLNGLLQRIEV